MLPSVLVLTVPKTGSTSLYHAFDEHPDLCLPHSKETWYFEMEPLPDATWYAERFHHCSEDSITIDFTSTLFHRPDFPSLINGIVPEASFVVLLRDPIQRLRSHYWHNVREGLEAEDLPTALTLEKQRLTEDPTAIHFGYRRFGTIYQRQVALLLANYPRSRCHFVLLEELASCPSALEDIACFLGLHSSNPALALPRTNPGRVPRSRLLASFARLPSALYARLNASTLLRSCTPLWLRRMTRRVRAWIASALGQLPDVFQREQRPPQLPGDLKERLVNHYNARLSDLADLIRKDIHRYWAWYDPDGT